MSSDILIVRVYLHEADQGKHKRLMREILALLQERYAVQGVTVFRAIAGFGVNGEVQSDDILRLNVDLPIVVEFFDAPKVAEAAIALLNGLVPGGHIVSWPAQSHGAAAPPNVGAASCRKDPC
jgi:PII-like signaling protein